VRKRRGNRETELRNLIREEDMALYETNHFSNTQTKSKGKEVLGYGRFK